MKLIAAVDSNWAIGLKNSLLVQIPADQKYFRQETTGKVIILGRKTLETFPNGLPLKNRTNIILSTNKDYKVKDALVLHSVGEVLKEVEKYNTDDVFVIGGESVYREFLPYCNEAEITKIDYAYDADAYFPNLDTDPEWELVGDSEEQTYYDLEYRFLKYCRKK